MLEVTVSLHNPVVLELHLTDWWPDVLPQDPLVESRIHIYLNYGESHWLWSSKVSSQHHTAASLLDRTYDVCGILWSQWSHDNKIFIDMREASSCWDVFLASFVTSWMSWHRALGLILVGHPTVVPSLQFVSVCTEDTVPSWANTFSHRPNWYLIIILL